QDIKKRKKSWKAQKNVILVQRSAVTINECSTWGKFHFQTFDHVKFDFPGTCPYIFASHCKGNIQDFNIQITRHIENGSSIYFTATIDGVHLDVKESGITVDGKTVHLPFSLKSVLLEDTFPYFRVSSSLGLTLKWNWGDTLLLDLEDTYKGKTCGLCGNYDGDDKNDFLHHGNHLLPWQFGNIHKVEYPTEKCPDVLGEDRKNQDSGRHQDSCKRRYKSKCKKTLSLFGNCSKVVNKDDYLAICIKDMCNCSEKSSHSDLVASCVCSTLNQYSRDCVLKGGNPGKWRTKELCGQKCPNNLKYKECGNPCTDTCFNPERSKMCKALCNDGCFCPEGTVLDDISDKQCIPTASCSCTFQGKVYTAGDTYSVPCQNCTCIGGQWSCLSLPCPGNCNIEGGFHITTFDKKEFSFHGNCHYLLAKDIDGSFVIIGEIVQCGISNTMTCLKNTLITIGAIVISSHGDVSVNNASTILPVTKDGVTVFRPSTFYVNIISSSRVQIQVQLKPIMQIFITVDETYHNRTSGLCGNFNNVQTDDFKTISGIVEDSAAAFGNSWKTLANCADVQDSFEDPCQKSADKEKFGQRWCSLLSNAKGTFAKCHSVHDPARYVKNCIYDTCNAEKSNDALCSIFSAYARNCATRGIHLKGWRDGICDVSAECPKTMVYSDEVNFCNSSCQSLREPDMLCHIQTVPVEGCSCPKGTYLANKEECVSPEDCPCYFKGLQIQAGNSFQKDNLMCKCVRGQLDCTGNIKARKDCPFPMYYFDCSSAGPGATGSECQKSCKTQDMHCYATGCVSGCMCPDGLVSNGNGSCIKEEQCPCMHGGNLYSPGAHITVNCNTCTCKKRQWDCTKKPCQGTCTVYGNGHYSSFDGTIFDFMGDCDYILAQDFCPSNPRPGTFRIVMQNIACGKSRRVCALKISIILEGSVIKLMERKAEEIISEKGAVNNYRIYLVGIYIIIETSHGMTFIWDTKTTVIVQLAPSFQGRVCGLCGDFDNEANNDFTTRGRSMEMNAQAFGNSWKVTSTCSAINKTDLCARQPSSFLLGQKHCSVLKSDVFKACHNKINPTPYFESCVSDFCGCDNVGDCESFCTAAAAYSRACARAGICIDWRSAKNCSMSCDYYNPPNKREWHYKPCGDPCLKTCRNPAGKCGNFLYNMEGCYPQCSAEKPYYDENKRECVSLLDLLLHLHCPLVPHHRPSLIMILNSRSMYMYNFTNSSEFLGSSQFVTKDTSQWCIYAFCNASCQTEFNYDECISFSTTPAPSKLAVVSNSTCKENVQKCKKKIASSSGVIVVPTFSPGSDCTDLVPPRKFQELWKFGSCQIATCLGGKDIQVYDVHCPSQKLKLCVNGLPHAKSRDESNCCGTLECQCTCVGWGNRHYVTFDGSYYNFQGNCTYLLMKPIRPGSQNFWIHIDNHYCAAIDKAICSMSLFIFYNQSIVTLTKKVENGKESNLVLYNNKEINPHFTKDGVVITTSGQYIVVKIPENGLYVTYSHLIFYINIPFRTFFNNTVGQCGTCTNKKTDDTVKRDGKIADSFTEMAEDWKVMDPITRHCDPGQQLVPSQVEISPFKMVTCVASSLCKLIWNLTECHHVVPPRPYYDACVMNGCSSPKQNSECESLQVYASLCAFYGICVDWRSKTNRKCGEKNATNANPEKDDIPEIIVEGCFCPDGMFQLNPYDSICVPVCGKENRRETWERDCQVCTCSKDKLDISCSPRMCAKSPPTICTKDGLVPVVRIRSEDPCCTEVVCECDVKSCSQIKQKCKPGLQAVRATSKDGCCPIYSCSNNMSVLTCWTFSSFSLSFKPRSAIPSDSCNECFCTETLDPNTETNKIRCAPVKCSTECQKGFHYVQQKGKCCGECVQKACVEKFSSGMVTIEVGETYKDPQDNCTQYLCTRVSEQFVLKNIVITCQTLNKTNCIPGTIEMAPNGCCETCILLSHNCKININRDYIAYKNCRSAIPVKIPSCEGSCNTYSIYSIVTHKMVRGCTCCHATKYHERRVELICSRRKRIKYTYLHTDECGCVKTSCPA
uniref:MUC5A protein n=1 Tax=Salvator merianae TaxID=96440 RepID=A0A8D0C705_SALMN